MEIQNHILSKRFYELLKNKSGNVRPLLSEQSSGDTQTTTGSTVQNDLPVCKSLLKVKDPGSVGSSAEMDLTGMTLQYYTDGGPNNLAYYIVKDGKRFCKISNQDFQ